MNKTFKLSFRSYDAFSTISYQEWNARCLVWKVIIYHLIIRGVYININLMSEWCLWGLMMLRMSMQCNCV